MTVYHSQLWSKNLQSQQLIFIVYIEVYEICYLGPQIVQETSFCEFSIARHFNQVKEEFVGIMTYKYDTRVDETDLHIEIISSKKYKKKA